MANEVDLSAISLEDPAHSITFEVPFVTGHDVGVTVLPDGTIVTGVSDLLGGVIIRKGDATNLNKTLVLRRGLVTGVAGVGAAANAQVWASATGGTNTTSGTAAKPAGAAGTLISRIAVMISATRMMVDCQSYEKGA